MNTKASDSLAVPPHVYIAGPMSGLPSFNYFAFNKLAQRLRAAGIHVENPAENPVPVCGTWQGYMRMALTQLVTCDTLVLLPGWEASRGASIERQLALDLGLRVLPAHLAMSVLAPDHQTTQTTTTETNPDTATADGANA